MSPFSILLIGIAMSTDAFAAAVGKGAAMQRPRFPQALRAGLIFGAIEAITPVIGWLLGHAAARYITAWDHWIAFGVLGLLGQGPTDWFRGGDAGGPDAAVIEDLIEQRKQARKSKDFAASDRIRKELADQGIVLEDGPGGTTWKRA